VYRVAEGLSPGPHTLVVTRETEGQMGTTILGAVEVVGGTLLAPGEQPRPLIELVGDSISAGFGDLGADQSCGYSYDTQSFAQTYGALAARTLGGEAVGIAMSSHGLYRNLDGSTDMLLPAIYERAVTNDGAAQWTAPLHPDVIVVNLGTNDFNAAADDPSQPFQEAYLAFVRTLRTLHPDALIVAAFGGMLGDDGPPSLSRLRDSIRAVLAARMLAGDARLAALEFPRNGPADLGCAWHPDAHKHAVMADQLVALLRDHGL
jgi:lysophospholipase L1-like esterase